MTSFIEKRDFEVGRKDTICLYPRPGLNGPVAPYVLELNQINRKKIVVRVFRMR
jgi:hypothetical protein